MPDNSTEEELVATIERQQVEVTGKSHVDVEAKADK